MPLQNATTTVAAVDELTHDIRRLVLELPGELEFHPGQYVDITIPGSEDTRSFSMANLPSDKGRLEFMIKLYPDGRFSGLLGSGEICAGTELDIQGPFGVFTLRDQSPRRLVFIGGGAGMAPILCLLRSLAGARHRAARRLLLRRPPRDRPVPPRGAHRAGRAAARLPLRPRAVRGPDWDGETGLITDVVERMEEGFDEVDAYVCGPPPMVEAAQGLLMAKGVPESRIYYDKFTTTESEETSRT